MIDLETMIGKIIGREWGELLVIERWYNEDNFGIEWEFVDDDRVSKWLRR